MTYRIGSVCSGYEGLGAAIQAVLGGEIAWVADNDPGASAILAHRYPGVPNLDDITEVDWNAVEPVDVFCAGFPCQDIVMRRPEGRHERGQPERPVVPRRPRHSRTEAADGGHRERQGAAQ